MKSAPCPHKTFIISWYKILWHFNATFKLWYNYWTDLGIQWLGGMPCGGKNYNFSHLFIYLFILAEGSLAKIWEIIIFSCFTSFTQRTSKRGTLSRLFILNFPGHAPKHWENPFHCPPGLHNTLNLLLVHLYDSVFFLNYFKIVGLVLSGYWWLDGKFFIPQGRVNDKFPR